jgi:hypothetical protein
MMGWDFALLRWSTLRYAENVGSQFRSLHQCFRVRLLSFLGDWVNSELEWTSCNGRLDWAGSRTRWIVLSLALFSEALDGMKLVRRFERLRDSPFLQRVQFRVGRSLA